MTKNKKIAVIGLGRFGSSMVQTLVDQGFEVMAVDFDEKVIQKKSDICDHVVKADCTDEDTLKELGIKQFDIVVVAIGRDTHANLMTSLLLVEMGLPNIVAKSESTLQGKMLKKIGIHKVIYPEKDMAIRVANNIISSNIIEFINLSSGLSLIEAKVPTFLCNTQLNDINKNNKFDVKVVAVKRHEDLFVPPFPNTQIEKDDILIVIGSMEGIEKMKLLE